MAEAACAEAEPLPIPDIDAGAGERLIAGSVCLQVVVDFSPNRIDHCAGSIAASLDGDIVRGVGACRYIGHEVVPDLAGLFPGLQYADLTGIVEGESMHGLAAIHTSLGVFEWDWWGELDGEEGDGQVAGTSVVEWGEQELMVTGEGWFEGEVRVVER